MFIGLLLFAHLSAALAALITPWTLITLLFAPYTWQIIKAIRSGAQGAALIPMLGRIGKLQLFLSLSLALALLV
jgi:1,4-dihydroxy-2-naphthoate octaprenyltransferase